MLTLDKNTNEPKLGGPDQPTEMDGMQPGRTRKYGNFLLSFCFQSDLTKHLQVATFEIIQGKTPFHK